MDKIIIPTFNTTSKKYNELRKQGKGSESLTALELFILYYTPVNVFSVPRFRSRLKAMVEEINTYQ